MARQAALHFSSGPGERGWQGPGGKGKPPSVHCGGQGQTPASPNLLHVRHPPFHPPCSPALTFLLFISTWLTVPVCQRMIAPSERTGTGQGGTFPRRGVRGCLQTRGDFPALKEEGLSVPSTTAAASSPPEPGCGQGPRCIRRD